MSFSSEVGNISNSAVGLETLVSLCRRRGFVFQSGSAYGGVQGLYDYGPLGVELKNNLKQAWWRSMIYDRDDVEGLDSSILSSRWVFHYSGHEETFSDPLVDCRHCQHRMRADQLLKKQCEKCGSLDLTPERQFNLMMRTALGPVEQDGQFVYLRPETAQGIFTNFKNVLDVAPHALPFGIAQIGKAFRNEITPRHFVFRMREFEQMELEYFVEPGHDEQWHRYWVEERLNWWCRQGLTRSNLQLKEQEPDSLAHYSKATTDILYRFGHGFEELEGIANRTDYDLGSHTKGQAELNIQAQVPVNRHATTKFACKTELGLRVPYVIEPSAGVDRGFLAVLTEAFREEVLPNGDTRIVLALKPHLAPIKVAIVPLARNQTVLVECAQTVLRVVRKLNLGRVQYEGSGNIGKAYRKHDEIGTPLCVTVDFQTVEDQTVTIRHRDTMQQDRLKIPELMEYLKNYFSPE